MFSRGGPRRLAGLHVESGPALFLSCEEPEHNIRDRVERIAKHRGIDPQAITDLHLLFPDLESTWLVHAGRDGRLHGPLLDSVEAWIRDRRPRLVVIDCIAAVFDGEAIARRQVRSFLAMLRKIAREHDVAIVMLDHPSVRGMADGSGTANWSTGATRSGRCCTCPIPTRTTRTAHPGGDQEQLRPIWREGDAPLGQPDLHRAAGAGFAYRASVDRDIEELFLRLLDKRLAQGRPVHAKTAKGSAPAEFVLDPEAAGITAEAFRNAMERLFARGTIKLSRPDHPASGASTSSGSVDRISRFQRPYQRSPALPTPLPTLLPTPLPTGTNGTANACSPTPHTPRALEAPLAAWCRRLFHAEGRIELVVPYTTITGKSPTGALRHNTVAVAGKRRGQKRAVASRGNKLW